jgi:hypothetical protein
VVLAVGHQEFIEMGYLGVKSFGVADAVIFDVKGAFVSDKVHGRL